MNHTVCKGALAAAPLRLWSDYLKIAVILGEVMRKLRLAIVRAIISTLGISGALALILGSASCFVGLSGAATIKLGELLNPHRRAIKVMMFYGSAGVGVGLFSIGAGVFLASKIETRLEAEELFRESGEFNEISLRPDPCVGCKDFNGSVYNGVQLICGMHPYGWDGEKCPDWSSLK